jgi:putative membrane protein
MNSFVFALAAIAFGVTGSAAYAAQTQKTHSAPDTATFLKEAANANEFEIESSQLALKKSQNPDVQQFAEDMVKDHTAVGEKMKTAVQSAKLEEPSSALNQKHRQMIQKLTKANGAEFNKLYKQMQTEGHQQAVQLFQSYSQNGDNTQIREFAAAALPTLKQHLEHIQGLTLPAQQS